VSVPSLFSLPFSTLIACRACDGELVGAPAVPCTVRLDSCNHTKDRIARLCYLRPLSLRSGLHYAIIVLGGERLL
jgi:hypothetical protein